MIITKCMKLLKYTTGKEQPGNGMCLHKMCTCMCVVLPVITIVRRLYEVCVRPGSLHARNTCIQVLLYVKMSVEVSLCVILEELSPSEILCDKVLKRQIVQL